jgi:hypothetical protein
MSVWPSFTAGHTSLGSSEGALVAVSVHVEPQLLEALLDALASLSFPINPQIYHDAAIEYRYADGREMSEPTTIVEFPAYDHRLDDVRAALSSYGFAADCLHVAEMLDDIHHDELFEPAPHGAPYISRTLRKYAAALH